MASSIIPNVSHVVSYQQVRVGVDLFYCNCDRRCIHLTTEIRYLCTLIVRDQETQSEFTTLDRPRNTKQKETEWQIHHVSCKTGDRKRCCMDKLHSSSHLLSESRKCFEMVFRLCWRPQDKKKSIQVSVPRFLLDFVVNWRIMSIDSSLLTKAVHLRWLQCLVLTRPSDHKYGII